MDEEFVARCKEINWQKIINVCKSLEDLNDGQLRFLKGRVIELLVENEPAPIKVKTPEEVEKITKTLSGRKVDNKPFDIKTIVYDGTIHPNKFDDYGDNQSKIID